jgi:hypothetical protein
MPVKTMEKEFLRLRKVSFEVQEGLIFGIGVLEPIKAGWAVGLKGAQNLEGEQGFYAAIAIAERTTHAVSRVFDDEMELWDVVMIFDNEGKATEAGHDNDQLSIFQIETGRLKWLV